MAATPPQLQWIVPAGLDDVKERTTLPDRGYGGVQWQPPPVEPDGGSQRSVDLQGLKMQIQKKIHYSRTLVAFLKNLIRERHVTFMENSKVKDQILYTADHRWLKYQPVPQEDFQTVNGRAAQQTKGVFDQPVMNGTVTASGGPAAKPTDNVIAGDSPKGLKF